MTPALGRCLVSLLRCTVALGVVGLSRRVGASAGPRQLHPAHGTFLLPLFGTQPSARDSAFAHGMRISANLPPSVSRTRCPQLPLVASTRGAKPLSHFFGTPASGEGLSSLLGSPGAGAVGLQPRAFHSGMLLGAQTQLKPRPGSVEGRSPTLQPHLESGQA